MPAIDIVLVAPIYEGNVGFCARVMKNFGFFRLVLIDPCTLGNEAKARASHAQDILASAETCTIEDVFARSNIVVATTGTVSKSVCHAMRMPFYSPKELRERIKNADGHISILFGRENWGLNNEEVKRSDLHDPDHGGVPDPQPLARGRRRLLRARGFAPAGLPPCFANGHGIPVPSSRPIPRCHPSPAVQAGEHHGPSPPGPWPGSPDHPRGEHPPRPFAPERVAHRPLPARPGQDGGQESGG